MAYKIFFKHLFTSIRRRPAQPLLLALVVAVAVMVSILAMQLNALILGEQRALFVAKNGNSNIIVKVKDEDNRFVDPDIAKELLGDSVDVCGVYALPFYDENNKLVRGVHADFDEVGKIFEELNFEEIKDLKGGALLRAIVVSKDFAQSHNLQVNGNVTLSLFGKSQEFKVKAITERNIMGEYAVLVDPQVTVKMMTGNTISSMAVSPYGTIYVHYKTDIEGSNSYYKSETIDSEIERLAKAYSDNAEVVANNANVANLSDDLNTILTIFILLVVMLSVATLYCCFSILTAQRVEENALFSAVGSKPLTLNLVSMAEMAIYWFAGSVVGVLLSIPLLKLVGKISGFIYISPTLDALAAVKSVALMFAATEISMLLYIVVERINKYRNRHAAIKAKQVCDTATEKQSKFVKYGVGILLVVAYIAMIIVTVTVRVANRNITAIVAMMLGLGVSFYDGGIVFKKLSEKLSSLNTLPVPVRYGIKNSGRVKSQSNVASLFSIVVVILIVMSMLLATCIGMVDLYTEMMDADFVVVNTTETAKNHIQELDCVESSYDALSIVCPACSYDKNITFKSRPADYDDPNNPDSLEFDLRSIGDYIILAASDAEAFTDEFNLYQNENPLPVGYQVYIGATYMAEYEVEIGDKVSIKYGGQWIEDIPIAGVFDASDTIFIVDAVALGINYNYTTVKGKEGYDKEEVYDAMFEACELDNVVIAEPKEMMSDEIKSMNIFSACIGILLGSMFIFATIGIADSVVSGYRSRHDEFDCYAGAGMNKKSLRVMKISETAYSFIVALLLVAVLIGLQILMIYECMISFNNNIFYYL